MSVRALAPVLAALRDQGTDPLTLLAGVGIEPDEIQDPEHRVPYASVNRFWRDAVEATGDPALGLHVVEHVGPGSYDVLTYLAGACPNAREAFGRVVKYVRVMSDASTVSMDVEGDRVFVGIHLNSGVRMSRAQNDFVVGTMVVLARAVHGGEFPCEAWFTHDEPDYVAEYARILEVPVRFGMPRDAMVGPKERLEAALPGADPALSDLLERHARSLLESIPDEDAGSLAGRVREQIARELPSGNPNADAVAEALGLSARTLRRRLREEGTSHRQILDAVRDELARRYLAANDQPLDEIAFLLGFSDASAFHKAFRRWTGKSPADWRGAATRNP